MKNERTVRAISIGIARLLGVVVALGTISVYHALADPVTTPWVFSPGQSVSSSKFNDNFDAHQLGINSVASSQIEDSTVLGTDIAQHTITQDNMGYHSVGSYAMDSGAISSDTMFAPAFTFPTSRLVSQSDTSQNFVKMVNGRYLGDGTDTRTIYCTQQCAGHVQGGAKINFTVTRVVVYSNYHATSPGGSDGSFFLAMDCLPDSVIVSTSNEAPSYEEYFSMVALNGSGLTWDPGTYATLVNNSDSHGFRVRDNTGGLTTANSAGYLYMWTAWGY